MGVFIECEDCTSSVYAVYEHSDIQMWVYSYNWMVAIILLSRTMKEIKHWALSPPVLVQPLKSANDVRGLVSFGSSFLFAITM